MILIEGKNIILRRLEATDATEEYYSWMNNPEVTKNLESRFRPVTLEGIKDYVVQMSSNANNVFLAIVAKDKNKHIGNIKLGPINWIHATGEIGIMIGDQNYWGKGIATEAIELLSNYAFETLNLHKVTAGCYSNNVPSQRAFLRAGFQQEGVRREQNFLNGKYVDGVLFGMIRPRAN